jgi:very-short-patch-repair endonuclease
MHQTPDRTRRARRLRSEMTKAEHLLWAMVRDRGLKGWKFRRQTPVAGSVADFFCAELGLIVELDGGVHRLREDADAPRDAKLIEAGFEVVRLGNEAFVTNPNLLTDAVNKRAVTMGKSPPHPAGSASHLLSPREKAFRD